MLRQTLLFLVFLALSAALDGGDSPPPPEEPSPEVLTKADIAMAAMDGLGGAVNNLAQELSDDFDTILTGMTPPAQEEWDEPVGRHG